MTDRDRDFVDGAERAARSLRAAVISARTQGVSVEAAVRIFRAGLVDAEEIPLTSYCDERAAELGIDPSGEPLPAPPLPALDDEFDVPVLHPGTAYIVREHPRAA